MTYEQLEQAQKELVKKFDNLDKSKSFDVRRNEIYILCDTWRRIEDCRGSLSDHECNSIGLEYALKALNIKLKP